MKENIFKLIESHEELPDQVKQKTMDSLKTVRLIMDIVDLFVMKSSMTVVRSFNLDGSEESASFDSQPPLNQE